MGFLAARRHPMLLTIKLCTVSSLICLWWLPIVYRAVSVALVNLLFIWQQMYISWRDFVTRGRPLLTRSLVLFVALYLSRRHWMVRTILHLIAGATDWGRCTALYPPIACSRLSHGNRLWCNSGTDNQWIFCVLNKQSQLHMDKHFMFFIAWF